jgi:CBS domain-containing protein
MLVHEIMTRKVITVGPETSIIEAANIMLQHHLSGLPVVDAGGSLIGIISEGDFIRRAEIGTQRERGRWLACLVGADQIAADFVHERGRKVGEIMSASPIIVTEDASLNRVVQIMESNNVKRLPVLREGRLVGIVARSDLLAAVANLAPSVPIPAADDNHIRNAIIAAIEQAVWRPFRLTVAVRDGIVHLGGIVANERSRRAAVVAAETVSGVKRVHDDLVSCPPPEEDLGGGDFVSLQEQPSTADDAPL